MMGARVELRGHHGVAFAVHGNRGELVTVKWDDGGISQVDSDFDQLTRIPVMSEQNQTQIALVQNIKGLNDLIMGGKLEEAFKEMNPKGYQRIRQSVRMAFFKEPKLFTCSIVSVIDAINKAVAYDLPVDSVLGRAYILPRWSGYLKCNEAHFQLGYKGAGELFYRSNKNAVLDCGFACEKDTFEYELGTNAFVKQKLARGDRGEVTHFWGYYQLPDASPIVHVMTVEEVLVHCDQYRSDKKLVKKPEYKGVWDVRFDQMGMKTVQIQLLKRAPMSAQSQQAIAEDEYRDTGKYGIVDVDGTPTLKNMEEETSPNNDPPNNDPPKDDTPKDEKPAQRRRMKLGEEKPAEPAKPVEASDDRTKAAAAAYIGKLTDSEVLAWIMCNRMQVKVEARALINQSVGIDSSKMLNENPKDKLVALATALCHWLMKEGKNIQVPAKAPTGGRPPAKA